MKVQSTKDAKQIKKTIKICIIALCVLVASGSGYLGFKIYQQISNFDIDNLTTTSYSSQVSQDGETYYKYGSSIGKYVSYDDIPEVMIDAVISAEDSRYFVHNGFDIPRIIKAFMTNILARHTVAGGSTITQQLIKKTYYPDAEKTIERKVGEVILSIEATQQTTKQKVLELYLNKIYFGKANSSIGIYGASYYYFGKSPDQLTLPEAALLAGTINSPVSYDPFKNLTLATKRRNIILNLMHDHGYITAKERDDAKNVKVENILKNDPIQTNGKYASYVDRVTQEVQELGYDPNKTKMTIYTYMDHDMQQYLDDVSLSKNYRFTDSEMQAAASVLESKTGRIIGLMSAKNYRANNSDATYLDYAYTLKNRRQPGSSIKPIVDYATAFEYLNWSSGHTVDDSEFTQGSWHPKNWDNNYHDDVLLEDALANSWNLAAIHTLNSVVKKVGNNQVVSFLKGLGYNMDDEDFNLNYAIGGWKYGTTPTMQAAAYAAISNGGTYIKPHTIQKIVINTTGETINVDDDIQKQASEGMKDSTAFLLRQVMTSYVKSNNSYSAFDVGSQIGAKTGTSNFDATIPALAGKDKDHWLCAYSPDYAWACWNGFPGEISTKKHKYLASGMNDAKTIAAKIAKKLATRKLQNSYETPSSVEQARMVKGAYPYVSPSSSTPSDKIMTAWFVKGHGPSGVDDGSSYADEYKVPELKSFNASLNSNNSISVTFGSYDPEFESKISCVVEISDGSSSRTETLSSTSGTLEYRAESGKTYTVTGYYKLKSSDTTSNKKSVRLSSSGTSELGTAKFSVNANGAAVANGSTISATSVNVSTSGPSGHTMIVSCNGNSQTVSCGSGATISGLSSGRSYVITFTEKSASGESKYIGSIRFTVQTAESQNDD